MLDIADMPLGTCRYEIKGLSHIQCFSGILPLTPWAPRRTDIQAPHRVVEAMHQQVSAERQKRATILASEALQTEQINIATGQARAVTLAADAQAEAIETVARAIGSEGGKEAVSLRVAERYVDAFRALAKEVRGGGGGAAGGAGR